MRVLFTSDLHFGHENVVKHRPMFSNVDEMDEAMIQNWNKKVHRDDEVYILGDFAFRSKKNVHYYLSRLKGKKHLIVGNHDSKWMKELEEFSLYFESVSEMKTIQIGGKKLILCHFPLLEWSGVDYMVHGHIHANNNYDTYLFIKENRPRALNCGVDINHFEPVTLDELILNNEKWYRRACV